MLGTIIVAIVVLLVVWVLVKEIVLGTIVMFRPDSVVRQCDTCGALVSANAAQCTQCQAALNPVFAPGTAISEWTAGKLRRVLLGLLGGWMFALAFRAGWMDEHPAARATGLFLLLPVILLPSAAIVVVRVWMRARPR